MARPGHRPRQLDWESASEIDTRSDFYEASVGIEHLLRLTVQMLATPFR